MSWTFFLNNEKKIFSRQYYARVSVTYPGDDVYILGMFQAPERLHEWEAKRKINRNSSINPLRTTLFSVPQNW